MSEPVESNGVLIVAAPTPRPSEAPAPAPATVPAAPSGEPIATPPAPTPAAPPATPAPLTLNDPPPPEPAKVDPNVQVTYQPTGDAGLDVALAFVGERGFGPDHPGIVAATQGDFAPLSEALKALGDKAKGYEKFIAAANDSLTRRRADQATASAAATKSVTDAVGGVEAWNAIQAWAKTNASPAEKTEINAAFSAGPTAARAMAVALADGYRRSGVSTLPPKTAVAADRQGGATPTQGTGPYGQAELVRDIAAIEAQYGSRASSRPEFAAAQAKFLAGRTR